MSQEDTPQPPWPKAPRFVPTLTEIVAPSVDEGSEVPGAGLQQTSPSAGPPPDDAAMELLQRLGPELDARISETIAQVLHEQMPILNARIRQAVAEVVRETVAGANSG